MLDNLIVYNSFNQHLGQPHHHPAGIPQGCPMSMMVLALLLRPWIIDMKNRELHPRTLADDVLLLANSHPTAPTHLHHCTKFVEGFQQTLIFFSDLGAKISPTKSLAFSSDPSTRHTLRSLIWTPIGKCIQVLNDTRDLGTHLNALTTLRGTTLTQRLHDTSDLIHKQRNIPLTKPHTRNTTDIYKNQSFAPKAAVSA